MNKVKIKLSVHQLVDFLLRNGDIDNRIFNRSTMNEGSKIHSYYQSKQGKNYLSEYAFDQVFDYKDYEIELHGRADGIIIDKDGNYIIDEIKTTVSDIPSFALEHKSWHLGQAKCYAYMFSKERNLSEISIRLTYFRQGHNEKQIDTYHYKYSELEKFVYDLFDQYLNFYNILLRKSKLKDESIDLISFPFENFRLGQKKLSKYVYSNGIKGGRLFIEAATGIGKTMSCIFPIIKLIKNSDAKIFYLTAKTSGKESAENAVNILINKGLNISYINVTAKEKICFSPGKGCFPDECPYAKGYYSIIKEVIEKSLIATNKFSYNTIIDIAKAFNICPFELQLDLSLFCDFIICDYNYVFDPLVYMKRYFDDVSGTYYFLIDEAHNLIDRSKEMFSSSFCYDDFLKAKKSMKKIDYKPIKRCFTKINKLFLNYFDELEFGNNIINDLLFDDYKILNKFYNEYLELSKSNSNLITEELKDFFLKINKFIKIYELYSSPFLMYVHKNKSKKDISINIVCLDASSFLKTTLNNSKATAFFSATLSPSDYYIDLLGGERSDPYLSLPSPFNKDNLLIMVAPKLSIKYSRREESYSEVITYIKSAISHKIGNYLVFCPSYEYLEKLLENLNIENTNIIKQNKDMNDEDKEKFINEFKTNPMSTTIGFAVLGGAFSEGIDLVDDRLIGAIIIGVGLPKINFVSDQSAIRFSKSGLNGNDYAYIYPGMNKVMQAVGRVIRSESDRGFVLLIDERYATNKYQELFKEEWKNYKVVLNNEDIDKIVSKFFKK